MSETDEARKKEAKAYQARQKKLKEPAQGIERFVCRNSKILKLVKMPNGNKYSYYVGTRAQADKNGLKYEIE